MRWAKGFEVVAATAFGALTSRAGTTAGACAIGAGAFAGGLGMNQPTVA